MLKKSLPIYTINAQGVKSPFPSAQNPAVLSDWSYTGQRMGGAPSITATFMYKRCLDNDWSLAEFVELEGERYYIRQVPSSSKNDETSLYKHKLTLHSRREVLDTVLFSDVATSDTELQYKDRYRSNSTSVIFSGDIAELAARLNDSLIFSGLYNPETNEGYKIVLDDGITSDVKSVSIEGAYITSALQEIYNIFGLSYYWVGTVCHIGMVENDLTEPLEYGKNKGLLSVKKTNADYMVVDRITGHGSSENIPYYYPNDDPSGTAIYEEYYNGEKSNDVKKITLSEVMAYNVNMVGIYAYCSLPSMQKDVSQICENGFYRGALSAVGSYQYLGKTSDTATCSYYFKSRGVYKYPLHSIRYKIKGSKGAAIDVSQCNIIVTGKRFSNFTKFDFIIEKNQRTVNILNSKNQIVARNNNYYLFEDDDIYTIEILLSTTIYISGVGYVIFQFPTQGFIIHTPPSKKFFTWGANGEIVNQGGVNKWRFIGETNEIELDRSGIELSSEKPTQYQWQFGKIGGTDYGVLERVKTDFDFASWIKITGRIWMPPMQYLMPSIYRETLGFESFYNAENEKYVIPDSSPEEYYQFNNLYRKGQQREQEVVFDEIKPTIVGVKNAAGQLFGEIADIAYDDDDSDVLEDDATTEDTLSYTHSYFYIKLHIFNGDYGFNLFDQALESGAATIDMTSGNCASCSFEIGVTKYQSGKSYKFQNPVQVDENGNIVNGNYEDKVKPGNIIPRQQNTQKYEVWIAVKKDNTTFNTILPNVLRNIKPQIGDTFVITNILMPKPLILAAEKKLEEELIRTMKENNDEKFNFSVKLSRIFIERHPDFASHLNENSRLHIKYNEVSYPLYVSSYTCKTDENILCDISVELTETLTISQNKIQKNVDELKYFVNSRFSPNDNILRNVLTQLGDIRYLSKQTPDTAASLITFAAGLISVVISKFLKGATFGDFELGNKGAIIDGNGSAEFGNMSVRELLTSNTAKIREIIDSITFDDIATFVQGLTTRDIYSDDWVSGLKGFAAYHKDSGKSYAEVDELLVRVKAVFNELEIRKLSYAGGNIELSGAGSTIYKVVPQGSLTAAPGNLISDSAFSELNDDMSLNASAELIPKNGYNELHIKETSASLPSYYGLHYYLTAEPGQDYTISFHYHGDLVEGAVLEIAASLEPEGEVYYEFPFAPDGSNKMELADNDKDTFVSQTITMPNTCSGLIVKIWLRRKGEIFISRPRVEKGDTATDWGVMDVNSYRCYLIRDDGTMATRNWWQVGDMAKCQTFNLAQEAYEEVGENGVVDKWRDVSNRYYWRAVIATGEETLDDDRTYNYVDLANTEWVALPDADGVTGSYKGMDTIYKDFDGVAHDKVNDAPMAGDAIVQEGNLINEDRQHVIKMTVIGENAPSIEEYAGVNDYQLAPFRKTMIAPRTGDVFVAKRFEIMTENGGAYRVPCDRGEYTTDMRCYYYDRVSYDGSLWLCISTDGNVRTSDDGTTEYVAPDIMEYDIWQRQVSQGESGKDAVNIVVTGRNVIFKEAGSIKVYVEVYVGDERLAYGNQSSGGEWLCGTLSNNHYLLDNKVYWEYGTDDDGKRFYYQLYSAGDFTSAEIPFTVTVRDVPYQKSLYLSSVKDGVNGEDALAVTLSPEAVILTQSPTDGSIDLQPAYTNVKVYKGMTDVTSDATISIAETDGCEAGSPSPASIVISSLIGQPETGSVVISVTYQGVTVQKTFSFAVNYLGKFKETIENDVKTQIASKEFSYLDEDGTVHMVSGISEIIQSSDAISQRVENVEDGLLTAQSEIKQNAESISMNVYAPDDENYLVFEGDTPTVSVLANNTVQVGISPKFKGSAPTKINFQCAVNTRGLVSGVVEFVFAISRMEIYSFTCDIVNTTHLFPIKEEFIINSDFNADNFTLTVTNKCNGVVGVTSLRMRKSYSINNGLTKTGIDISKGTIHLQADNTIIDSDVTVKSLETLPTKDGAYVKLNGGMLSFFGRNLTPSIEVGIDEETGNAILKFYDSAGRETYNLGPGGLAQIVNNSGKDLWSSGIDVLAISNGDEAQKAIGEIPGVFMIADQKTTYYMFSEGYIITNGNKTFIHGGTYDRKWYINKTVNSDGTPISEDNLIADGWYAEEVEFSNPTYKDVAPRFADVTIRKFVGGKCVWVDKLHFEITYTLRIINVGGGSTSGGPITAGEYLPYVNTITPATITLPDLIEN